MHSDDIDDLDAWIDRVERQLEALPAAGVIPRAPLLGPAEFRASDTPASEQPNAPPTEP
jgi:hypothetical protein